MKRSISTFKNKGQILQVYQSSSTVHFGSNLIQTQLIFCLQL